MARAIFQNWFVDFDPVHAKAAGRKSAGRFWVNNHAHILTGPTVGGTRSLTLTLQGTDISGYLTGSTMPKLSQTSMNRIRVVLPSPEILNKFQRVIDPAFAALDHNERQSQTLAALRDTLLPKLISGELRVPDAERIVGRATG